MTCPVIRKLEPAPCSRGIHLCPHVFITGLHECQRSLWSVSDAARALYCLWRSYWCFVAAPSDVIQRQNCRLMNIHGRCMLIASTSDKIWQKWKEYVFRYSVNVGDGCRIIIQIFTAFSKSLLSNFHPSTVSVFIHCGHKPIYGTAITQPKYCLLIIVFSPMFVTYSQHKRFSS